MPAFLLASKGTGSVLMEVVLAVTLTCYDFSLLICDLIFIKPLELCIICMTEDDRVYS